MDFKQIIIAIAVLCGISLVIGIVLSIAEKVFRVDVNEKELLIRAELPGSNCGGCGYAGCDSCAKAIAEGKAPVSACPVGGTAVAKKIGAIMGEEVGEVERKVAFVKCSGSCDAKKTDYNYFGVQTCGYAAEMPDSSRFSCKHGCLGYGTCATVCDTDAIKVVDGKAVVDENLCIACGKCVKVCPHNLIEIVPAGTHYRVQCSSTSKGKDVMNACTSGCIGCSICAKNCPNDAIVFENNIAKIDYSKCSKCGTCVEKCPRKIIKVF